MASVMVLATACSPVSDEEMERLRGETEALAAELTRLKGESELLDRALTNAYREKDRVVDRLNVLSGDGPVDLAALDAAEAASQSGGAPPGEGQPDSVAQAAPAAGEGAGAPAVPAGTRSYVTRGGDTLSHIARANGTTVQAIVALNPKIANRPGQMVWEGEAILLPE
jgi:LysM repeat protein